MKLTAMEARTKKELALLATKCMELQWGELQPQGSVVVGKVLTGVVVDDWDELGDDGAPRD